MLKYFNSQMQRRFNYLFRCILKRNDGRRNAYTGVGSHGLSTRIFHKNYRVRAW